MAPHTATIWPVDAAGDSCRKTFGKWPENRQKVAGKPLNPLENCRNLPENRNCWNSLEFTGSSAEFTQSNPIELRMLSSAEFEV